MAGQPPKPSRYRFGVFDFDADALELRRQTRLIKIRPQSLKLLRLLVARPGQAISREEIQSALWGPDVFVDFEQGVNHCVKQLRAALGDDAEAPRYLQTIPRLGYRFIAPVETIGAVEVLDRDAATNESGRRATARWGSSRWIWAAASLATAGLLALVATRDPATSADLPSSPPALAVLPFEVRNMPVPMHYLGVSLADALIATIAARGQVRVRPISTVLPYESQPFAFREIGEALSVDYILSGTLERTSDSQSVRLALIRSIDGVAAWNGVVSGPTDDLQSLERKVADHVISALNLQSIPGGSRGRTNNSAAHEAYLEGRYRLARFTGPDTLMAVDTFERALALDGNYALAHAGLGMTSAQMYIRFGQQPDINIWKTRAERHSARALELDANLAEAHEALAAVARYTEVDWERVIEQSFEALRLNPSLDLPHYYVASALQHVGKLDLVEDEVVAGLVANPLNLAEAFRLRGVTALWSGRFSDARMQLERVRQLAAKPVTDPHFAQALYYGGDAQSAETMLAGLAGSAQAEQRAAALLASFLAARGERARALALVETVQSRQYHDHHVDYSLGVTYAGLGKPAEAMHWLREATRTGFLCYPWYQQDPLLNPLRASADFQLLLTDMKNASARVVAAVERERTRR